MKNKLFWPIVLISIVIIIESVMLLSAKTKKGDVLTTEKVEVTPIQEVKKEEIVEFKLQNEGQKVVVVMKAKKEVAIDAIDLYISYKGVKVGQLNNLDELPKPTFSKVSQEKSLVVFNYLISDSNGFKILPGQEIKVAEINYTQSTAKDAEFMIDAKTQVVETGSAKVLPFTSQNLIVNSTL